MEVFPMIPIVQGGHCVLENLSAINKTNKKPSLKERLI
jgi:hypothetical protein